MEIDDDGDMLELGVSYNDGGIDGDIIIDDVEMSGDELLLELKQLEQEEIEEKSKKLKNQQRRNETPQVPKNQTVTTHEQCKQRKKSGDEQGIDKKDIIKKEYDKNYGIGVRKHCESNRKKRTNRDESDADNGGDDKEYDNERHSSKRKRSYNNNSKERKSALDGIDRKRLNRYLEVSKTSDPMIVGREIAYRLHENKMQLIGHVVRVLGVNTALDIFEETKELVQKGGLKTDEGDRKRTPGGTFLYIMKNRAYATDQQIKEIFKYEKAKGIQRKKRTKLEQKIASQYLVKNPPKEAEPET